MRSPGGNQLRACCIAMKGSRDNYQLQDTRLDLHMITVRNTIIAVVTAIVSLLAPSSTISQTYAANPTCTYSGTHSSVFDGGNGPNHTTALYGARAWIVTQPIGFCDSSSQPDTWSDTSAWSMLGGPGALDYAQSGYLRSINKYLTNPGSVPSPNNTYYFMAYNAGWSTQAWNAYGQAPLGQNHEYWQAYNVYAGRIDIYADNTLLASTSFDPGTTWGSGWDSQFMGETHDPADFMPGTTATHDNFTYLGEARNVDSSGNLIWYSLTRSDMSGNWCSGSSGCNQSTTNYQQAWLYSGGTDPSFSIWDNRH